MSKPKDIKSKPTEYKLVVTTAFVDLSLLGKTESYQPIEINNLISDGWVPLGGPSTTLLTRRELQPNGMKETTYMLITQALTR